MNAELKKPNEKAPNHGFRGFGLVELITAITVLGILAAILIPVLSGVSGSANDRRYQRMAQEFSLLAGNATAAGNREVGEAATVAEALELLVSGVKGGGVFADTEFRMPNVTVTDQTGAARHLKLEGGMLVYAPAERSARSSRPSHPAHR